MNKIAHYLQGHVSGEVMDSAEARRYFSTDDSVFSITPTVVVYPSSENDVRKAARFSWQLAERGRIIPITARGSGTNQCGAAIGTGIILVFPAHLNQIVEFDAKNGDVIVEPGINFGKLQQVLYTHNRFLPTFPSSLEYSTIGGAIADNSGGEKSIKYGDIRRYVKALRVVLANGEVIETSPLSKRDLSKKLGLTNFEGEVYRSLDSLLEENHELISKSDLSVSRNSAGYALNAVKSKKGFDLTPLIVGSQGTLGIVTEAMIETEIHNPGDTLIVGFFEDLKNVQQAVLELRQLSDLPSALEMVDGQLLELVDRRNPNLLKDIITKPYPKYILFVEFDNANDRLQKRLAKRTRKIFEEFASSHQTESDDDSKADLWKIRRAPAVVLSQDDNGAKPLPLIEDGIIPVENITSYINGMDKLFQRNSLQVAIWGHIGEGNLHAQPLMDLTKVGDRQRIFRLMDDYYDLVIKLGGSTSAGHNDGRLRTPYLRKLYGDDMYNLFLRVKKIFDPHNILNPGVKTDTRVEDLKDILRHDYPINLHNHLSHS